MQVKIGPEFFAKAFNDYSNWRWALIREYFQNSIDCGSTRIDVSIVLKGSNTIMTVSNDGDPMTREIIVDKLLSLGSSGKGFKGAVGGFGKAKEILYFTHRCYSIRSGVYRVDGVGGDYDLFDDCEHLHGTVSTIEMVSDDVQSLIHNTKLFLMFLQWSGTVTLNGAVIQCNLRKGKPRGNLEFGTVYTNRSFPDEVIVRMNGIPMFWFSTSAGIDRCVILELNGKSSEVLAANRDCLRYPYSSQLTSFIVSLSTNRHAIQDNSATTYELYSGAKLYAASAPATTAAKAAVVGDTKPELDEVNQIIISSGNHTAIVEIEEKHTRSPNNCLDYQFLIKNETDMSIPQCYIPNSDSFGEYSRKLANIWSNIMLEMHKLFNRTACFTTGFVFSSNCEAVYENGSYGDVYLINPVVTVTQKGTKSRSFKKRFKFTERSRLIMLALHEFVHGIGYGEHNESYAAKLTDMSVLVMDNRACFNKCFV